MRFFVILATAALATGCTSSLTEMIEAMGKDPATMCSKIIYGPAVVQVYRTNAPNAKVKCTNDGMEVESTEAVE